jgi:hypothetical protein
MPASRSFDVASKMDRTAPVRNASVTASSRMKKPNASPSGMQSRAILHTGGMAMECSMASTTPAVTPLAPMIASL